MERIFPRALVACIAEGRSPQLAEFEDVVAGVRRAFAGIAVASPGNLPEIIADIAFHGCRTCR